MVIVLVLAGLLVAFRWLWAEHELLFGSLTVFVVLTTAVAFASVFVRRHMENDAALTFLLVAALSVAALILIAHDWARRQLVIAAIVAAAALSLFIVRLGYESLSVPPRWERAQIAAQAQADENALEAQHARARPGLLDAARTARATLSGILARPTAPDVDPGLLAQATVILHDANTSLTTIRPAVFSRFDVLVLNEPVTFPPAATTELADAVDALRTAEASAAKQIDHSALDQAICAVTGHKIRKSSGTCGAGGPDEIMSHRAWVVAKHDLDVELATYRVAITRTAADKAALKAVLAQQPDAGGGISVLAAIEKNGPETLWGSAFRSAGPPLMPGPLGWVVLGALLLGLLGWLLKVNASQLAGPVEVLPGDNDKKLVTVLRVAVLRNVPEPGPAPGAPSASPVTTLLDIASGPLGAVSKIVQTVLTVAGRRYGYQVSMDVTTDAPTASGTPSGAGASAGTAGPATAMPSAASTTVLARVMSVSGGVTLASFTFREPDVEDAVEAAGLWAAGYILQKSSRIPSWAEWNAETARALAMAENTSDSTIPLPDLESALREAPDSGILLTLVGHRYELAGRRIEAISCYARAVAAHPHYWVARYRLAVALGAMRHDELWGAKDRSARQDDLRAVGPAIIALKVKVGDQLGRLQAQDPADAPAKFRELATALLKALATDTRYKHRLVSALRRSERDSTWPSLAPMSTSAAHRFHPLVKSACLSLGDEDDLSELSKEAAKRSSWWQISYNAACGYASIATNSDAQKEEYAQKALCLLEQTLVRPGIHQLSAAWVKEDCALSSLAGSPRFSKFLAQLRPGD